MSPSRFSLVVPCVLVAALAVPVSKAEAGVVQYEEIIEDVNDFPFIGFDLLRDLHRERTLGTGETSVEEDDAAIVAENVVSPSFGLTSTDPITYSHRFIADPAVLAFETLSLTITAYSVSGGLDPNANPIENIILFLLGLGSVGDDLVEVDGMIVGTLVPGGPLAETVFQTSTGDELLISLLLADNRLDLAITPAGTGTLGFPDQVAVRASELTVTYLAPEPGAVGLLGLGLLSLLTVTRRARRARRGRAISGPSHKG